jgi:hypothetical protein
MFCHIRYVEDHHKQTQTQLLVQSPSASDVRVDKNVACLSFLISRYRPIALTSQILRVSSRRSLTISVRVQQPHTAQK